MYIFSMLEGNYVKLRHVKTHNTNCIHSIHNLLNENIVLWTHRGPPDSAINNITHNDEAELIQG